MMKEEKYAKKILRIKVAVGGVDLPAGKYRKPLR